MTDQELYEEVRKMLDKSPESDMWQWLEDED